MMIRLKLLHTGKVLKQGLFFIMVLILNSCTNTSDEDQLEEDNFSDLENNQIAFVFNNDARVSLVKQTSCKLSSFKVLDETHRTLTFGFGNRTYSSNTEWSGSFYFYLIDTWPLVEGFTIGYSGKGDDNEFFIFAMYDEVLGKTIANNGQDILVDYVNFTITELDDENQVLSGTFSFKLSNIKTGETYSIKNGIIHNVNYKIE